MLITVYLRIFILFVLTTLGRFFHGSGSGSGFFADLDPDSGKKSDPDPKHWFISAAVIPNFQTVWLCCPRAWWCSAAHGWGRCASSSPTGSRADETLPWPRTRGRGVTGRSPPLPPRWRANPSRWWWDFWVWFYTILHSRRCRPAGQWIRINFLRVQIKQCFSM